MNMDQNLYHFFLSSCTHLLFLYCDILTEHYLIICIVPLNLHNAEYNARCRSQETHFDSFSPSVSLQTSYTSEGTTAVHSCECEAWLHTGISDFHAWSKENFIKY
jgi:hypothetical protein